MVMDWLTKEWSRQLRGGLPFMFEPSPEQGVAPTGAWTTPSSEYEEWARRFLEALVASEGYDAIPGVEIRQLSMEEIQQFNLPWRTPGIYIIKNNQVYSPAEYFDVVDQWGLADLRAQAESLESALGWVTPMDTYGDLPTTRDYGAWETYFGVPMTSWDDKQWQIYSTTTFNMAEPISEWQQAQLDWEREQWGVQQEQWEQQWGFQQQQWEAEQERLQYQDYMMAQQAAIEMQRSPLYWPSYWSITRGGPEMQVPEGYGTPSPSWWSTPGQEGQPAGWTGYNFPENQPVYQPSTTWRGIPQEQPLPPWFTKMGGRRV